MESHKLINIIVMTTIFVLIFSVWCICVFLWLAQYLRRLQTVQQKLGIGKKNESVLPQYNDSDNRADKKESLRFPIRRIDAENPS